MSDSFKIKSRLWIETGGHVLIGEGRVKLLKAIEEQGSLSKAAKSIGMSYKKAWNLIDSMNKSSKEDIVISSIGGQQGGGTMVTEYGKNLIDKFETINQNCWNYLDQQLKTLNNL